MRRTQGPAIFLAISFLAIIAGAGSVQIVTEIGQGEWPEVFSVFLEPPTTESLRAYEQALEDESFVVRQFRPWIQYLQFLVMKNAGEKTVTGRQDWLFYRPSISYFSDRTRPRDLHGSQLTPVEAIVRFRDRLKLRNIHLLVVPTPNKVSVYPEKLTRRAESTNFSIAGETRWLLEGLHAAEVETVDLFTLFAEEKQESAENKAPHLYMAQDTHWSPSGLLLAAKTVGRRLLNNGWVRLGTVAYDVRAQRVSRVGDLIRMLQIPQLESHIDPEQFTSLQIVRQPDESLYEDDPNSEVLVLGDSFLRVYEHDDPGAAGFVAHLARELQQPLTSIVSDGGASTLVRQELFRRPDLLANKRIVVWQFVERDIRFGTEGWQDVPLPPEPDGG